MQLFLVSPLTTLRVDKLSLLFGYVFLIAALLGGIYALHVADTLQQVAALVYAGSALGAVFAGDLVTLFIFWEGIAVASVFLIWAARNERAFARGHALPDHPDRLRRAAAGRHRCCTTGRPARSLSARSASVRRARR